MYKVKSVKMRSRGECKVDLLSTLGPTAQSDLVSRSDREHSAKPWLVGPCQTVPIKGGGEKGAENLRFDAVHRKFHLLTLVRSRGGTGLMGSTTTPSSGSRRLCTTTSPPLRRHLVTSQRRRHGRWNGRRFFPQKVSFSV